MPDGSFADLTIRDARPSDAKEMARVLNEIIKIGGTTSHKQMFDARRIVADFVSTPFVISCLVAEADARILGFQLLEWSDPDWRGPDKLPADWALIATYVDPVAQNSGIGRALFCQTASRAHAADARYVDATIAKENTGGAGLLSLCGI